MKPDHAWPKTVLVKLERPHKDARGYIQPLVDVPMKSALMIASRKGTVRANHYHKKDWHYCYVVSGEIDYFERPVGSRRKPRKTTVKQGQLFFTRPMVEHAMVFTKDTVFLTLSRQPRDPTSYEDDLIRVELVRS